MKLAQILKKRELINPPRTNWVQDSLLQEERNKRNATSSAIWKIVKIYASEGASALNTKTE